MNPQNIEKRGGKKYNIGGKIMDNGYVTQYDKLKFTDDFIFCKILESNPDLCKELLEVILGVKIREVKLVSKQREIRLKSNAKGVRFDVYLEDAENTVFNLEMQTTLKKELPKRSRYYQGMMDMDLIQKGAKYAELKKSYVIFICTADPFHLNLPIYHFENLCMENKDLLLGDEASKVFINSKGVRENISADMKAFLDFLEDREADSHLTKRLQKEVENARQQEEWRHEYMTLEEKYEEYLEEGREIGKEIGIEEGKEIGKEETVLSFLNKGLITIEAAAEELGITPEELQEKMKLNKNK